MLAILEVTACPFGLISEFLKVLFHEDNSSLKEIPYNNLLSRQATDNLRLVW